MTESNLISLRDRSPEERSLIAAKGGRVKSEAKRMANQTKNLKHGRYAKQLSLTVQELAKNPEKSAIKIFDLVERIGVDWDTLNPRTKIELARLYCEAHRVIHGTKQVNVNLNTDLLHDLEGWFQDEKTE
jgi:hypothetical protein